MQDSSRKWSSPTFLTVEQVSEQLQLPLESVYKLIHGDRLRAINLSPGKGRVLRVRREDLDAFLKAQVYQYEPIPGRGAAIRRGRARGRRRHSSAQNA